MNNEEPIRSVGENQIVSTNGSSLPEQPKVPSLSMPRPMSFSSLIHQWQPMGYRVVVNLPFVGNDSDFLFYIRNGPFIPGVVEYSDVNYNDRPTYPASVESYARNNMAAVFLFGDEFKQYPEFTDPKKNFPVTLTQYDAPPPISALAQSFRRWRGSMQYRIRVVAGSITQGYIIITPLKNVFVPIAIYDQFQTRPAIQRQDRSYCSSMMNSYGLVDAAMMRHAEISMPFDYPVPYYDQYAWMARRVAPSISWSGLKAGGGKPVDAKPWGETVDAEPHGDNFIAVGLRGALAASITGSQLEFELEYRCGEDFQFADPFLPPQYLALSNRIQKKAGKYPYTIPNRDMMSDGVGVYSKKGSAAATLLSQLTLGNSSRRG